MDAIEYALMRRYSWPLETIREMPIRDRWLALHEELADLQWDEEAQQVWLAKIEPVLPGAPGTDYDVWRSDAPGFHTPSSWLSSGPVTNASGLERLSGQICSGSILTTVEKR